jgi:hypothetical protein
MQKQLSFYYVICNIWPQIWYLVKKIMWKMQYKPIENYHLENAINFGAIGPFFHVFTL